MTEQPRKAPPPATSSSDHHKPRTNAACNGATTTATQIKGVAGEEDPLDVKRPQHG